MRKLYLTGMVLCTLLINSYVADHAMPGDVPDPSPKITHFYPNPATSYINFTFDNTVDKSYSLQVYNFIGRKMSETKVTESRITLTLDDSYLRGLYIYQLRDQTGRIIESGKFQVSK